MAIGKEWEAPLSWRVMIRKVTLIETNPRCHLLRLLPRQIQPVVRSITSNSSSSSSNISYSSWAEPSRALATGSDDVREITSSSRSSLLVSPLSNLSARSTCDPHKLSFLHASAAAGCPSFLEKKLMADVDATKSGATS
ncbi:hypothetical protein M9458_015212 [Cirrhinus mrigala]|uniref:Uncharacterized protein n=1 Tax=Cirrhinus mrigala TaxID=683832 RepID=A0ABD0QPZ6_CIRMR